MRWATRFSPCRRWLREVGRTVCGENIISASVGVASWPEDGLTADELLAEADRRMYANKNSLELRRGSARAAEEQARRFDIGTCVSRSGGGLQDPDPRGSSATNRLHWR